LANAESSIRFNFEGESKNIFVKHLQQEKHELHKDSTDDGIVIVTKLEAKNASASIERNCESLSKETVRMQVLSEKQEFSSTWKIEGITMQSDALKQRTREEPAWRNPGETVKMQSSDQIERESRIQAANAEPAIIFTPLGIISVFKPECANANFAISSSFESGSNETSSSCLQKAKHD
jgi:hypothetical protein